MLAEKPIVRPDLALAPSCNSDVTYVQWTNLPLACPMPGTTLWDAHPRVYLPIHRTGRSLCKYCGTLYILADPSLDERDPDFANTEIEKDYRRAQERVKDAVANNGARSSALSREAS